MKQTIYLDNTPLDEALGKWKDALSGAGLDRPFEGETVPVIDSLGRVTAEAVIAKMSSPLYNAAAMDGYAVRFTDTFGASETRPKRLSIPDQAVYVATGNPMPDAYNAVIMIEDVNVVTCREGTGAGQKTPGECIEIIKPATPWQHVRTVGEDIVVTELILPENHRVRPVDIGAMLAGGFQEVTVRRRPKVVVIPTGSELVEPADVDLHGEHGVARGSIIESNSRILTAMIEQWGGEPVRWPIVPDDMAKLKNALSGAARTGDLIVMNAGASAGKKDFTSHAIRETGEVILHGVNIKPGKPVILGRIHGTPVLGIPGYPVSAYITFELFAKPCIHTWLGLDLPEAETIRIVLSRQVFSTLGVEEFVRVKVGRVGDKTVASPISRGAGMLMSLVRADGFIRIPAASEGAGAGEHVDVRLIESDRKSISNTIVCIGSHDNVLDILANSLRRRYPGLSLSSTHVGSMGGLIALRRGEAHIAGTHLLDEETGQYNVPFVKRLLPDEQIVLVTLVHRQQGLFARQGNPKRIRGFEDLLRGDITFINRQPGSGTRLLTDKYLRDLAIDPLKIRGYDREEYTHMTAASAVLNGIADTGLGILAAAMALGLDFIPVAQERYDLAIPERFLGLDMIQKLLEILRNDTEFRKQVKGLGGYDVSDMGSVVYSDSGDPDPD